MLELWNTTVEILYFQLVQTLDLCVGKRKNGVYIPKILPISQEVFPGELKQFNQLRLMHVCIIRCGLCTQPLQLHLKVLLAILGGFAGSPDATTNHLQQCDRIPDGLHSKIAFPTNLASGRKATFGFCPISRLKMKNTQPLQPLFVGMILRDAPGDRLELVTKPAIKSLTVVPVGIGGC